MKVRMWKLAIIIMFALTTAGSYTSHAKAGIILEQGSANGDVWDIQFRLKLTGYLDGSLDGHYGPATYNAVRDFQRDYGLKADGIIGDRTWIAMKKYSLNRDELDVMAKIIYSEARGESYTGQVAVGAVVMNRIQSQQFPDTIYDVVFQPGAFTAIDDGQYWLTPNRTAYMAAQDAVRGWDPTGGSLYYFNPDTASSRWIWSLPQNMKIGRHIFAG
jgi:N-acetylmuramoyl-L-alanine amidase